MPDFSVRCGKCPTVNTKEAADVFAFMTAEKANGWQIPDALENQPILCPVCKANTNFPTTLGRTPNQL
jgi:hypothetical protein